MKNKLIEFLSQDEYLKKIDLNKLIQKPKLNSQGDLSLPCFLIAKELDKKPNEISKELSIKLTKSKPEIIEKIIPEGPFLNFYFNNKILIKNTLNTIYNKKIFKFKNNNPKKILIEFPSPNTNKSLHIGHVRNMLLGSSISRLLKKIGNNVIITNMNNDRGIAICKAMLSYQLFGKNKTPKDLNLKPDEFVSYFYILFNKKNKENPQMKLDKKAQEMLVEWEKNNPNIRQLWKKILTWVFEGYEKTYKNFKLEKFDKQYFESEIYDKGKDIIINTLNSNIDGFIKEDDGAIAFDFKDKTYGKKYLLRGDGTSLYITQDLYLAYLKEKDFHADKYIFVVGKEQKYHFEVLFKILEKLGFGAIDKNYHLAYGYVFDKNGNKFSSRLGNTLGADETLNKIIEASKKNLLNKNQNLNEKELNRRANIIGFAALSFNFLKINPLDDMNFDIEKAISFEGETGPYILYTYARIQSILKKSNFKYNKDIDYNLFNNSEINLIKNLKEYNNIIIESAKKYRVSNIANYLIKISQKLNEIYQNSNILKSNKRVKQAKLNLIYLTSKIIKDGLEILGIEVLEEM